MENLLAAVVFYSSYAAQIIGSSRWTVGDDSSVTMTANGPVGKFTGIEVDGEAVDAENYMVKSGSTVISLKPEYLSTLSVGNHTLTVIYTDGEASGGFEVLSKDGPIIPQTGYNGDIALWITLLSIAAVLASGYIFYPKGMIKESSS